MSFTLCYSGTRRVFWELWSAVQSLSLGDAGQPASSRLGQPRPHRPHSPEGWKDAQLGELRLQPVRETDIDILHINIKSLLLLLPLHTQFYTNILRSQSRHRSKARRASSGVGGGGDSMRRCSSNVAPHTYSTTHFRVLELLSCSCCSGLEIGQTRPTGWSTEAANILSLRIRVNIRVIRGSSFPCERRLLSNTTALSI